MSPTRGIARQSIAENRIHTLWLGTKGSADKVMALVTAGVATIWGFHIEEPAEDSEPLHWFFGMSGSAWVWFSALLICLSIWAIAIFWLQRPRYSTLFREHEAAKQLSEHRANAIESALTSVMKQLSSFCRADGNDFRTSLYYYHRDEFIAVARYSQHPEFRRFRDDGSSYDASLGVIGETWRGSEYYKSDLPEIRENWNAKVRTLFGFSTEQVHRFRMHSRSYAAIRIDGHDAPVGVLVFESTRARGVSKETIAKAKESLIRVALAEMVSAHAKFTPQVEKAAAGPVAPKKASPPRPWKTLTKSNAQTVDTVLAK